MTMTPPPFDPELAAALEAIKDLVPRGLTMDDIPAMRQGPGIALMAQLDLTVDGFEVEDRLVPGPEGEPEISLLVCRPAAPATPGPLPVICHVHGGDMIVGNNRGGVDAPLGGARRAAPRQRGSAGPGLALRRARAGRCAGAVAGAGRGR